MSQNPYGQNPYVAPKAYSPIPPVNNPRSTVSGPAIGLMVVSIMWLSLIVLGIAFNILIFVLGMATDVGNNFGMDPEVELFINLAWGVLILMLNVIVLWGAIQMKNLKNFGLAMTAAIIAVIPCIGPCYLLGIPFGIWALVVLNKPEVKNAFR